MTTWRRFEVLLPDRLDNGEPLPRTRIDEALDELSGHQMSEGNGWHAYVERRHELVRIVVEMADTVTNRKWMKAFKQRWKERMQQPELRMVSYPIDIE